MCWRGQLTFANLAKYYHRYPDTIQSSKTYLDKIAKIRWSDKDMGCDRHGNTLKMFIVCINILCWGIQRVVAVANKQKSGIRNRSLDSNRWLQELAHESLHRNVHARYFNLPWLMLPYSHKKKNPSMWQHKTLFAYTICNS